MSRTVLAMIGLIVMLCASACLRLDRERPEKRFFLIETVRAGDPNPSAAAEGMLQIRRFDVSPAFEAPSFVYRTGEYAWESDYYNAFFTSPDAMLTEMSSRWLGDTGLFMRVASHSSQVRGDYLLEGHVVSLYGDYRPGRRPEAVIEMQVLLLRDLPRETVIVLQGNYMAHEPVAGHAPGDLVAAWGRAMHSMLTELEGDLARVLAGAAPSP
jgi:cholesterol transport system auxiliary component